MSRPRKKVVEEEIQDPVQESVEDVPVVVEEPIKTVEEPAVVVEEPAVVVEEKTEEVQSETVVDDNMAATIEWATQYIGEHSRRRPGSVSGMMPTAYRITISGGRVRYFNLPISVEECAVEESWKRCKAYMTPEEFIAFLTRILNIPPPPFYSVFRIIAIE